MITYKYSIIEDIKMYIHDRSSRKFYDVNELFVVQFTIKNYIKFLYMYFTKAYEMPQHDRDVTCYFVSHGTWGAYRTPDKIFVCPLFFEECDMTMYELIDHEITHLDEECNVQNMTHQEKEDHINKIIDNKKNDDIITQSKL